MLEIIVLLLLEVAAQPGFPPCGLLGEPLANVSVAWSPEVPSLQSWVTFNITGLAVSYEGALDPRVILDAGNSQFWLNQNNSNDCLALTPKNSFSCLFSTFIPGPLILLSGIYQYHMYLWGGTALCMQELVGNIAIGTTLSFTVLDFTWTPAIILSDSTASLLINGQNGPKDQLTLKQCQLEILINPSQLLDKVACEVSNVQPEALFQVNSEEMKFPDLEAGNYTVRVHFYDEEELGYVETGLQIAGEYPLSIVFNETTNQVILVNNGEGAFEVDEIFTDIFATNLHIIRANISTCILQRGEQYPIDLSSLWVYSDADSWTVRLAAYKANITVAFFTLSVEKTPIANVSSLIVTPAVLTTTDIVFIDVQSSNVTHLKYWLFGYENSFKLQISVLDSDNLTYVIASADLSQYTLIPGNYVLSMGLHGQYPYVLIDVSESNETVWVIDSVINHISEYFAPGGYIQIVATVTGQALNTSCQLSVTNYFITWQSDIVPCQQQTQKQGLYELTLPVIPLPIQFTGFVSGAYILKIDLVNSADEVEGSARGALYLTIKNQITPLSLSIFPTTIFTSPPDALAVIIEGQASEQSFSYLSVQSTFLLYNNGSVIYENCEVAPGNWTWQGDIFQYNLSLFNCGWASLGNYTLMLCLHSHSLGLYCWRTNTTLISEYRLAVTDFQWNQSLPLVPGTNVSFSFDTVAVTPGNFSQNHCQVILSSGNIDESQLIECEVGIMSEGQTATVTSGPLQLPLSLEGQCSVDIQLLSSTGLTNGYITTKVDVEMPSPTPIPNEAFGLIAGLWVLAS